MQALVLAHRGPKQGLLDLVRMEVGANLTAGPLILPNRLFGANAPANKITMGFIGVGWQGRGDLNNFLGLEDCQVVSICDGDEKHLNDTENKVNSRYGNTADKDFRERLARKDIDAVCISTPDHWHSLPAIAAANVGTKNQRIWQTGPWQRGGRRSRAEMGRRQTGNHRRRRGHQVAFPANARALASLTPGVRPVISPPSRPQSV